MNKIIPYTPFSMPLSSSARETELRLKNIFSGPKKRPPALFLILMFSACVLCGNLVSCQEAEPGVVEQTPPVQETELPTEDHVLLSLEAPLADGRTLTLDAVGKELNEYSCGVREVLVYDGDTLLQTVSVREVTEEVWSKGMAEEFYGYTECWSPDAVMETLDLNFDGNTDFGLFGWVANNTIPYYYWQWDGEQYQYSCTLQGAEVHPEAGEVSSEYKGGWGGAIYQRDYYRLDGDGSLYLVRQERERIDFPNWDGDRGSAIETWVPREGAVIRPGGAEQNEGDFVLIRREIPVYEINSDNTASHFTEIWELKDGRLQMTSRDPYIYD